VFEHVRARVQQALGIELISQGLLFMFWAALDAHASRNTAMDAHARNTAFGQHWMLMPGTQHWMLMPGTQHWMPAGTQHWMLMPETQHLGSIGCSCQQEHSMGCSCQEHKSDIQ
jgi:D-lyxose ketol-isomerase